MASTIVTKHRTADATAPTVSDIIQGELAINFADEVLYSRDEAGNIVQLGVKKGTSSNSLVRWNGTNWVEVTGVTIDGSGNMDVGGTLDASGATTLSSTLGVTGDTTIGDTGDTSVTLTILHNAAAASLGRIAFSDGVEKGLITYEQNNEVMRFYTNGTEFLNADLNQNATLAGNVLASPDNANTLGGASNRWSVVYAGTGTINTSDAREKTAVTGLTADELEAAKLIGKEIGTYKWLAAIEEKGDSARKHIGLTVQKAIEIMESCNLVPSEYGFICYDEWTDEFVEHPAIEPVEAVEATEEAEAVEAVDAVDAWTEQINWAGNRYGFRYDELLAFVAAGFNARLEALEAK